MKMIKYVLIFYIISIILISCNSNNTSSIEKVHTQENNLIQGDDSIMFWSDRRKPNPESIELNNRALKSILSE